MRVLIFALGSAGDVHPFIGIGRSLSARGHEVTIAANGFFEKVVTAAGLGFRAMGTAEDYNRLCAHPDLWHPHKAVRVVMGAVSATYSRILEIARELHLPGETVLVGSSLAFGARNVRDLLEVPLVTVHLAPTLFPSVFRQPVIAGMPFGERSPRFLRQMQWAAAGKVIDYHVLPDLNRFRRSHGLPPARGLLHQWWHSPDRVIGLFPQWFAPPQPDWPSQVRLTGFPLFDEHQMRCRPPELDAFLDAGDPPVVFTPGSAMMHCGPFFEEAVAALRISGRRGILLSGFSDCIPPRLPPEVRHFTYLPFSEVLPRSAALIYHGGIGTCAQALRAGIPHLVMPMAHDQHDNLSRVRDLGVGDGLAPRHFKASRICQRLDDLLGHPTIAQATAAIATRFESQQWIKDTCNLIENTRFTAE